MNKILKVIVDGGWAFQIEIGMFIWFQRIILIPGVVMLSFLIVNLIARLLLPLLGYDINENYVRGACWVVAVLGVWLYVLNWKKIDFEPKKTVPRPPARPISNKFVWALAILVGVPLMYSRIQSSLKSVEKTKQPGYEAFQAADLLLTGRSQGVSHGNTPDAKALAGEFSSRLKEARRLGIEARKSSAIVSLTGGEFLTYCLLTRDHCVFLVHVPDLRKFTPEAKDFIAEAAWATALAITEPRKANLRTLVVGLRGAFFYDRVLSGRLDTPVNSLSLQPSNVEGDTECQTFLQGYFSLPSAASSAMPPARTLQPSPK